MAQRSRTKIGFMTVIGNVRLNVRLNVELSIKINFSGGGDVVAMATLFEDRQNTPVEGTMLIFCSEEGEQYRDNTDEEGRVSYKFIGLSADMHVILVGVNGFPGIQIILECDLRPPFLRRVPTKFKVTAKPKNEEVSHYEVAIELGDENGGIEYPVVIVDMNNPDPCVEKTIIEKTKFNGIYIYKVDTDRPRELYISAIGTEHETNVRLPGPRKENLLSPPPKARVKKIDILGSCMDIARRAHIVYKDFWTKKRQGMNDYDILKSRPLETEDYDLPIIRKWWFNFTYNLHYDNYRWKILFYFVCSFGALSFLLTPFIFTVPSDNTPSYLREADEEFYKGIIDYKEISGGKSAVKIFVLKFLYKAALMSYSAFTFFSFTLFIYTFFAFGDDFKRALQTARVRMWDKYGAELTTKAGPFSKLMLGQQQSQQVGIGQPIQGAVQMPMQGYAPITRRYYLFWETLISVFSEFFAKIFVR